jgi:hypothetical protein
MFWCAAACFGVLKHVLVCCSMFWCAEACFGVLQHVLVC